MDKDERIIVAFDTDAQNARALAQQLKGRAKWIKIGMTLYYSAGPEIVAEFKELGFKVFVDLKLHDIPHQVRGAAESVALAGADMLTVHAAGGTAMMQAALEGAETGYQKYLTLHGATANQEKPICLAITVLTSLDDEVLKSIGVEDPASTQVLRMAQLAQDAGMHGIVCSPQEASAVRQLAGEDFYLVTPGVRPIGANQGDQARTATPKSALLAGADYLVIGRPITGAANPGEAFNTIALEME